MPVVLALVFLVPCALSALVAYLRRQPAAGAQTRQSLWGLCGGRRELTGVLQQLTLAARSRMYLPP
jgi:hypothetical protein